MLREISTAGRAAVFAITLATGVSACGIKGPLKLPPAPSASPESTAPAAAPAAPVATDEVAPGKKP